MNLYCVLFIYYQMSSNSVVPKISLQFFDETFQIHLFVPQHQTSALGGNINWKSVQVNDTYMSFSSLWTNLYRGNSSQGDDSRPGQAPEDGQILSAKINEVLHRKCIKFCSVPSSKIHILSPRDKQQLYVLMQGMVLFFLCLHFFKNNMLIFIFTGIHTLSLYKK